MPVVKVTTTTLICDFCPTSITHGTGAGATLTLEYFFARHWSIDPDTGMVTCPRCQPILRTVASVIDDALSQRSSGKD
ncbi:hypothetical protein [Marisediminicola senii]|uniref:hypothetical protein n=1 Tax=Marisediminicola senii TaxID=2711233 RepID=UPI0013EC6FBE|nr:hypothetical protein [Marisediminicola senii]